MLTNYYSICLTLEQLREGKSSCKPSKGSIAYVMQDASEYEFDGTEWRRLMDRKILIGSKYFFKGIDGFSPKDTDWLILIDKPVGFTDVRRTSIKGTCLFEWRKMSAGQFLAKTLGGNLPMAAGKFLVPEVCAEIGFTLEHLKKLEPVFNKMDEKHKYEKVIFQAYIDNGKMELTQEQRMKAYEAYKEARKYGL